MFVDLPGEEWRSLPGYDGLYEVSSMGRVRSWSTRGSRARRRATEPHLKAQARMKDARGNGERLRVGLQWGRYSHLRGVLVHHLVALAFIGPRPKGMVIRHRDGDPSNNRVDNLLYGTQQDNMADALRHGTVARGRRLPQTKLDEARVVEMRRRFLAGEKLSALSAAFGVSWASCQDAVRGVTWKHVDLADAVVRVEDGVLRVQ